ncbi:MAG: molybdopterin cofactor-binding domain-containing protein, partial [Myxococcota bacterium]
MASSNKVSRRFLLKSGAAAVVVLAAGGVRMLVYRSEEDGGEDYSGWVEVTPDNLVHILYPSTEMGQGSQTGLPQILADELDADWERVVIRQLNEDDRRFGNPKFGNVLYTAGSSGVYSYFKVLRHAGAHLRDMMRQRVADEWGVDMASVTTAKSVATHAASGRSMSYGDIVALPNFASTSLAQPAALKSREDYTLIGKSVPRRDIPAKSTGKAVFAIDVRVPDMLYATVVRSPVEGESIVKVEDEATRGTKDVVDVVALPDGVAVLAKTLHASLTARAKLKVTWTEDSPFRNYSSGTTLEAYRELAEGSVPGKPWRTTGDV